MFPIVWGKISRISRWTGPKILQDGSWGWGGGGVMTIRLDIHVQLCIYIYIIILSNATKYINMEPFRCQQSNIDVTGLLGHGFT